MTVRTTRRPFLSTLAALGPTLLGVAACSSSPALDTQVVQAGAQSLELLPPAPVRAASTLFLPGLTQAPPEQVVQVYLVLTETAPAATIPRGIDIRSSATVRLRFANQLALVRAQQARVLAHAESVGAELIAPIEKVGNALHLRLPVASITPLRRNTEVDRVEAVPFFKPALAAGVPAVGTPKVWERVAPLDGDGITLGVMDSGVDYLHAAFGGPGTTEAYNANDPTLVEAGSFPTARVVGGRDFAGDNYDGSNAPTPDGDPIDCARQVGGRISGGHGTHVAGIAAGNGVLRNGSAYAGPYNQSLDPAEFEIYPGVAPKALIHAIRVFGCDGGTTLTGSAYDYAIDPDGDGDPSDRLDVLNASLGSDFGIGLGFQATLVDNLTRGGTVFVAAAGNAGSSFFITGQPAGYASAISVAATSESALPELRITSPSGIAGSYDAVSGGISAQIPTDIPISGRLVAVQPANGCGNLSNAAALAGNIALVDRGTCTFEDKLSRIEAAGASAAVVVQNRAGEAPFPMGGDNPIGIPAVMIGNADGVLLKSAGGSVNAELFAVEGKSQLSPFSSRGPESVDGAFKPEIAAPGGNIRSAGVGSGFRGVVNSGTSMASPLAAGAAALVRQAHPTYLPTEVKAALINTGVPSFVNGLAAPVSHVGGGRIQVDLAIDTQVLAAAEPSQGSGVSFEPLIVAAPATSSRTVRLTNKGTTSVDFDLLAELSYPVGGVSVSPSQASVSIGPGATQDVELVLSFDPAQLTELVPDPTTPPKVRFSADAEYGRHFLMETGGMLRMVSKTAGQSDIHVPFNGAVRPAGDREMVFAECGAGDTLTLEPQGDTAVQTPVVGVFELGAWTEPELTTAPDVDVIGVGAASDFGTREFEEASAFIAVVVDGTWTTPAPNSFEGFQSGFPGKYLLRIDTNFDRAYDYEVVALASEDVLISYSTSRAGQQGSGRFFNIVPADVLNTQAYYNSVLILPVFLAELGLTAEAPSFAYQVLTVGGTNIADTTEWVTFDPAAPAVNASPYGLNGRPLFSGTDSIKLDVNRAANPRALILHFDNIAGKRGQPLDIPAPGADESNLSLTSSAPASALEGEAVTATLEVQHVAGASGGASRAVTLQLSVEGATLVEAKPSIGTCNAVARTCDLGELAPGETASIEAVLKPLGSSSQLKLTGALTSDTGCGALPEDDATELTVDITPGNLDPEDTNIAPAGGGCSCRAAESPGAPSGTGWLGLGVALLAARRRQRRAG